MAVFYIILRSVYFRRLSAGFAAYTAVFTAVLCGQSTAVSLNPSTEESAAVCSLALRLPSARVLWVRGNTILHSRISPWFELQVSQSGVAESRPRWAPDGYSFIFERKRGVTWDVFEKSDDFKNERLLLSGAHTADWCDSGQAITAIVHDPYQVEAAGYRVVKRIAATGETQMIYDARAGGSNGFILVQSAALDPTGQYLLCFTTDNGHESFVYDLANGRYLKNAAMERGDCNPGWAPGGDYITTTSRTSIRPVLAASFDRSASVIAPSVHFCGLVSPFRYYAHGHRISPDGRWLTAGVKWIDGPLADNRELYVWDLDDTNRDFSAVRLTFDTFEDHSPSLHHQAVHPAARAALAPTMVSFDYLIGSSPPHSARASIICLSAAPLGAVTINRCPAWVSVSAERNDTACVLGISSHPERLAPGVYTDTLEIAVAGTVNSPFFVLVRLRVSQLRLPEPTTCATPGIAVAYYALDNPVEMPDFDRLTPLATDTTDSIAFYPASWTFARSQRSDSVGALFTGRLLAPHDGVYTFIVESDDGARLRIGNSLVVESAGPHLYRPDSGSIGLLRGQHELRLEYYEARGDAGLVLRWKSDSIARSVIPRSAFFLLCATEPALHLLYPSGGEVLSGGTVCRVRFVSSGVSQVAIELSLDGGEIYQDDIWTADFHDSVWGNVPIVLPDITSDNAVLRIAPYLGGITSTVSAPFRIVASGAVPRLSRHPTPSEVRIRQSGRNLTVTLPAPASGVLVRVYRLDGALAAQSSTASGVHVFSAILPGAYVILIDRPQERSRYRFTVW